MVEITPKFYENWWKFRNVGGNLLFPKYGGNAWIVGIGEKGHQKFWWIKTEFLAEKGKFEIFHKLWKVFLNRGKSETRGNASLVYGWGWTLDAPAQIWTIKTWQKKWMGHIHSWRRIAVRKGNRREMLRKIKKKTKGNDAGLDDGRRK